MYCLELIALINTCVSDIIIIMNHLYNFYLIPLNTLIASKQRSVGHGKRDIVKTIASCQHKNFVERAKDMPVEWSLYMIIIGNI